MSAASLSSSTGKEITVALKSAPDTTANPAQLHSVLDHNLTFTLGSEEFGIQVLHIKQALTPQAGPPTSAIHPDIRQLCCHHPTQIIPVADLSLNFDFRPRAYTDRTCIVVVSNHAAAPASAPDTLDIASEDIELSPELGDGAPLPYLLGMARVQGTVRLLQHPIHALLKIAGNA